MVVRTRGVASPRPSAASLCPGQVGGASGEDTSQWSRQNPADSPGYMSRTLLSWIRDPVATRTLGPAILRELKMIGIPVLTYHLELESEIEALVRVPGDCQL